MNLYWIVKKNGLKNTAKFVVTSIFLGTSRSIDMTKVDKGIRDIMSKMRDNKELSNMEVAMWQEFRRKGKEEDNAN